MDLSEDQLKNIATIISRMILRGITNKYTQASILAVISKESTFIPKEEKGYQNTDNARIRKIFGIRVMKYSEDELTQLKKNPESFFNAVYGNRYGNGPEEGFLYRGRGLNQVTFKSNYVKLAKQIGVDIVSNPDLLNDISVAADAVIQYFLNAAASASVGIKKYYRMRDINSFVTLKEAVGFIYHANAGLGKSYEQILKDSTGGRKKSMDRAPQFLKMV